MSPARRNAAGPRRGRRAGQPAACRAGACGTCRQPVKSGTAHLLTPAAPTWP
ncbi:2Fe-2S iron-sulfur cluster-binding protein [Streptomyces sp. NPDC051217]|uniref:2Fe-2S iron-sulfur cluster-binding protein n=1 Tax=Streptomyces sp. NPDC051217 TaxID=3365644 RepID=UPI0037AE5990